jgi:hypothetical protein
MGTRSTFVEGASGALARDSAISSTDPVVLAPQMLSHAKG